MHEHSFVFVFRYSQFRFFIFKKQKLLMSFCAVAARYADMEGRRDLKVDIRL